MYEMWKRKQIHEDVRNMYRTKIHLKKVWHNDEDNNWEAMIWSEGRTNTDKS